MTKANVSVDAIGSTPPEIAGPSGPVGSDPLTRDPILDQKMGAVGKCLGYGEEKKGNIAGVALAFFAVVLCICIVAYVWSDNAENRDFLNGLITPVFGVITGAIGYITGRKE
jgi:hypothetical protein